MTAAMEALWYRLPAMHTSSAVLHVVMHSITAWVSFDQHTDSFSSLGRGAG